MDLTECLEKQMKCCLSDDGHIAVEPISVTCGGNACKQCIIDLQTTQAKCYKCGEYHEKENLDKMPLNEAMKLLIEKTFLKELTVKLKSKVDEVIASSDCKCLKTIDKIEKLINKHECYSHSKQTC